ncbi:DUF7946 domain-containing protein [Comamonas terrae]|uniref:DUF7946 domain-containing protein n=1 Tax=Comamonas terrae TaxID=673548 RepID=A0ABW5UM82_9BURK|nr:hypothetical protein [Comamonas terrae]
MDTTVSIIHEGGNADSGKLDLYDSAESLLGFARAVNLISHAFANDNEIKEKLKNLNGFNSEFTGAKRGCFELSFLISFNDRVVKAHGHSVIVDKYWDYFSAALSNSVGLEYVPSTHFVNSILEDEPYIFDHLAEQLESPLKEAHRTIQTRDASSVHIYRPRVGDKVVLNYDTYRYISETTKSTGVESWEGNVTKYNLLTGYGRFFNDSEQRTVPFVIKDFGGGNLLAHQAAASSMSEASKDITSGKRVFQGYAIRDMRQRIKRIEITDIQPIETDE